LGRLEPEALAPFVAAARALVLPSRSEETFGLAAAEALLAGRPVIAANLGALPELVEHEVTGLLVAAGDAEGFGAAAQHVLADELSAARWGRAGQERLRTSLDPARHVAAVTALFERVLLSARR
ncbi:MAG: glycosyltransferase, partial [Candidatus Eisenbacteria bacterium]|nr:glycosyltransferase [Candidatus Eisenbacteria bacterium]